MKPEPDQQNDRGFMTLPGRRPFHVLLVALFLAIAGGLAITRFDTSSSIQALFDQRNPAAKSLGRVMDGFGAVDELLVLATVKDEVPTDQATGQLIQFAQSFEEKLYDSSVTSSMIQHVEYRVHKTELTGP